MHLSDISRSFSYMDDIIFSFSSATKTVYEYISDEKVPPHRPTRIPYKPAQDTLDFLRTSQLSQYPTNNTYPPYKSRYNFKVKMYASPKPMAMSTSTWKMAGKFSQTLQARYDGSTASLIRPCANHFLQTHTIASRRPFSTTRRSRLREIFPPPANAPNIKVSGPAWHHPV